MSIYSLQSTCRAYRFVPSDTTRRLRDKRTTEKFGEGQSVVVVVVLVVVVVIVVVIVVVHKRVLVTQVWRIVGT